MSIFNLDEQYNRERIVADLDKRDDEIKRLKTDYAALQTAARKVVDARSAKHGVNLGTLTDRIDDLAALLPE